MILGLYYLSIARDGQPGEGMVFGSIEEVDHALHAGDRQPALEDQGPHRADRRDRQLGDAALRHHARPPAARAAAAEELQDPVRHRQPPPAQEGGRRGHRHRLPPLRPEGIGDLLRPDHGPRLHRGVQGRHLVRQGRHGHPRHQVGSGQLDPRPGQGVRAAVHGRPDHPGREVQQGGRRLVQVLRRRRRRDDGRDLGRP